MTKRSPLNLVGLPAAVGLLAIAALPVAAADWQFNPKIEVGAEANDNYRLFPSGLHDSVYGGYTNAALQFRYLTQTDDFSLTPGVYALFLPDSTDDNTTDPSVNLNWKHTGQTFVAGLFGQYLKQSVVQADLTTSATIGNQLGNPVPGDSGYITFRDRRTLGELTPTVTWDLTPRQHLEFDGDYSRTTYDPLIPNFNVGYSSLLGKLGFTQDISPRMTLTARGLVSQYNPEGDFGSTRSYGLEGEWGYHVSQISQAYIRVGAVRSSFEQLAGAGPTPDETGVVAGAGINWTFKVTQIFLDATRDVEPNATGYTVNRDQLRLRLTRAYSATVLGEVGARYYHDSPTQPTNAFVDRTYAVGYLNAKWRFLRAWTLNAEYDYTNQHFASVPPLTETQDLLLLSVIYEPNRRD